tara:strand:+ start:404 stop:601 length:198 start_codon:yes stop_codon:yes gene_type:complete
MDETDYLIINPIQIELLSDKINNEKKISVIEEMFYKKMEKLKKISLQNKRLKSMLKNHKIILIDI